MATAAQLAANRANALKSTGPRTATGKAASAQNARKHGLTAVDLVIAPEDQPEFDRSQSALLSEINPQSELEGVWFDQLVHAAWSLRLARRREAQASSPEDLALYDRYCRRHESSLARSQRHLTALQTARASRERNKAIPSILIDPRKTAAPVSSFSLPRPWRQTNPNLEPAPAPGAKQLAPILDRAELATRTILARHPTIAPDPNEPNFAPLYAFFRRRIADAVSNIRFIAGQIGGVRNEPIPASHPFFTGLLHEIEAWGANWNPASDPAADPRLTLLIDRFLQLPFLPPAAPCLCGGPASTRMCWGHPAATPDAEVAA
jgi:hypothetical protein